MTENGPIATRTRRLSVLLDKRKFCAEDEQPLAKRSTSNASKVSSDPKDVENGINSHEVPILTTARTQLQEQLSAQTQQQLPAQIQQQFPAQLQDQAPAQLQDQVPAQLQEELPAPEQNTKTIWLFDREFPNEAALLEFLSAEKCWSVFRKITLVKGSKTLLRCNRSKRRGKQCAKGLYFLKSDDSTDPKIKLFKNNHVHDCVESNNKIATKVSVDVREFILKQYELGNKLGGIMLLLRDKDGIVQPTKKQVDNIIHYYKPKATNPHVSIAEMENFVKEHLNVPDDEDTGFVVNFSCSPPRTPDNEKFFRIFYSTKRLLGHTVMSKIIHADGTYQIIVQGYPILVVGVSDIGKRFHLGGIAITSSESSEDYKFLFESLQVGVIKTENKDLKPETLVADAAVPITKGFADAFDDISFNRVYCYAHMMSNVQTHSFRQSTNKEEVKADLRSLQLAHDKATFVVGWKSFETKWMKREPLFVEYFKKTHINSNGNWYEGYAHRTPSTNNCLETFNRLLKQQQMASLRKPLNQFMVHALTIVRQRSREYITDKMPPTTEVPVSNELRIKAWNYSTSEKSIAHEENEAGHLIFYVFAGDNMQKITLEDVRNQESYKPKKFDDFITNMLSIYKISFDDVSNWLNGKCTCPAYLKSFICKHIIAIAHRMNVLNPPDELLKQSETPASKKNPRGRPRRTTKALIRD